MFPVRPERPARSMHLANPAAGAVRFQQHPDNLVTRSPLATANRCSAASYQPKPCGDAGRAFRSIIFRSIIMKRIGERAVVIGASMAGLLAARALADFYDTVTVLDRDAFPISDLPRKGVPQGRHAHGLLARGRSVIEQFFPGWTDEVVASGGVRGDIAGDVSWVGHGVTLKSAPSDLVGLLASRPVLEGHVRRRLLALSNVRAIENCAVQSLVASEDHSAVKGVRARIGSIEQIIDADLVVDASGRGSSSPA